MPNRESKLDEAISKQMPRRLISFRSVDAPFSSHSYFRLDGLGEGIETARATNAERRGGRGMLARVMRWLARIGNPP